MAFLARYLRATGQIVGVWSAPSPELLQAQRTQDDATYGSVEVADQDPRCVQEQAEVQDGQLVAKQALTLTATPAPFRADGVSVCTVTVVPWRPCTLRVAWTDYALTEADPVLELVSEVPRAFEIGLVPQPGCWAPPLTVEAQMPCPD